jgi:hypothetical protein
MKMNKILFLLLIISGICIQGYAQSRIEESPKVKSFMEMFMKIGKEEPYIEGWRIKVISTTDRRALESAKWIFDNKYPDLVYSLSHEPPYYSMKVGAFETRIDVEPLLVQFKEDFPLAIPFRDRIMKTELFAENGN